MGDAKRRKQLDPNYGILSLKMRKLIALSARSTLHAESELLQDLKQGITLPPSQLVTRLKMRTAFMIFERQGDKQEFLDKISEFPQLAQFLHTLMVFSQADYEITIESFIEFWQCVMTEIMPFLGQLDFVNPNSAIAYWCPSLKYLIVRVLEQLNFKLSKSEKIVVDEFFDLMPQLLISNALTSLEVGLATIENSAIYTGQALVIFYGNQRDEDLRGELKIAVKHSNGCWTHYPSPKNVKVVLSEYKQAKTNLQHFKLFKYPLRGELINSQSHKLAKLLGLTITGNYAYLIND